MALTKRTCVQNGKDKYKQIQEPRCRNAACFPTPMTLWLLFATGSERSKLLCYRPA